jgi:hypothetical protein
MSIKNYSGQLADLDSMNSDQKASFRSSYRTVVLPVGYILWRFTSLKEDNKFGAFWMDHQTMEDIMQTFQNSGIFSASFKNDVIRDNLAVLKKWSNVNWRVKIRLLKEVVCYIGEAGTQIEYEEVYNDTLIGGEEKVLKFVEKRIGTQVQFVIPRFRKLPDQNAWAAVEHFVHV